jgi:hypothetical protein
LSNAVFNSSRLIVFMALRARSGCAFEALPEKYFGHSHLPGARPFPHDQGRELAAAMLPEKQAQIVVYCASATLPELASGSRSADRARLRRRARVRRRQGRLASRGLRSGTLSALPNPAPVFRSAGSVRRSFLNLEERALP